MTFGQLVLTYFDELLPVDHITYTGVDVKYTDVPRRTVLDSALQKAVYHDMFPNASIDLGLDRPATVADLAGLLQYHF